MAKHFIKTIQTLREIETQENFEKIVSLVSQNLNQEIVKKLYEDQVGKLSLEISKFIAKTINDDYVKFRNYAKFYGETIKVYF